MCCVLRSKAGSRASFGPSSSLKDNLGPADLVSSGELLNQIELEGWTMGWMEEWEKSPRRAELYRDNPKLAVASLLSGMLMGIVVPIVVVVAVIWWLVS